MTATADLSKIAEILEEQEKNDEERRAKENTKAPVIIDELRDLLDNLREESSKELETSILAEGIRDPIIIWKERNAVLDGHNRLRIAQKHNLPYPSVEKSFPSIDKAKEWMLRNQLGRRNLTADRFDYLLGKLYNDTKQKSEALSNLGGRREKVDEPVAQKLAEEFGVSERTVRRAGETALGIDKLEQIRGRIAKNEQLSGKGQYTKPELTELGKMPNQQNSAKYLKKLDELKAKDKAKKVEDKQTAKAVSALPDTYGVVFVQPNFDDIGFNVSTYPKPSLAKDAAVYMMVPDHALSTAMKLLEKWALIHECSFVYYSSQTDEGVYSKVAHEFLLMATKGTVVIKRGVEASSVQKYSGQVSDHMIKLIDTYHPGVKKLDMRKGRTAPGWDGIKGI